VKERSKRFMTRKDEAVMMTLTHHHSMARDDVCFPPFILILTSITTNNSNPFSCQHLSSKKIQQ
jgi:hypothetical protein